MEQFFEIQDGQVDVQKIMEKIREDIERKKAAGLYPDDPEELINQVPAFALGSDKLDAYLKAMQESWQINTGRRVQSDRLGIGPLIVLVKKVTRRLVRWYMDDIAEQIIRFNSYSVNAMGKVTERLNKTDSELDQKFTINSEIAERVKRLEKRTGAGRESVKSATTDQRMDSDIEPVDYLVFENKFRGDSPKIAERQKLFLEYFRGQKDILDIGCGRGEFLNLLKEAAIPARGIELNGDFVDICRDKGLDVEKVDALSYLANLKDGDLGGIFAGQVIEHLSSGQLARLVKLAYEKLRPGGYFVAETINPTCLSVFAKSFYIDPTHIKPVHPETIQFILESEGFDFVKLHFLSPPPDEHKLAPISISDSLSPEEKTRYRLMNENIVKLNQLLYSYEDYAVVARKQKED